MIKTDKTTVAKTLKKLKEAGFIKRVRDESDSRQWLLYPSDKLNGIYEEFEDMILSISRNAFSTLTEKELKEVLDPLSKIAGNVNEEWLKIKKSNGEIKFYTEQAHNI